MEKKINAQITPTDYKRSSIGSVLAAISTLGMIILFASFYMQLSEVNPYAWVGAYIVSHIFYLWFASPQAIANSRVKAAKKMEEEIAELERDKANNESN